MTTECDIIDILYFRHACKVFDTNKSIEPEILETILEGGRLSPSSFGMEPWKFIVIKNNSLRKKLQKVCWNQAQITDSSELIAIIALTDVVKDVDYYSRMFERRRLDKDKTLAYIKRYESYIESLSSIEEWVKRQCYIAATQMMITASSLGVDSCPIEGFEPSKVDELLQLPKEHKTALLLPLGYRVNEASEKLRKSFSEIVETI